MICIIDFNGYTSPGHLPIAYWADYDPVTGLVFFGGEFSEVSPVQCDVEPNDVEIEALQAYAEWIAYGD